MESGKEHVVATSSTLASFKPESLLEDELSQSKTKEQQETRGNLHEESVLLVTVCGQRPRHTCAESTRQHIETGAERQAGKTGGMKPISSPVPVQRNQFGRALTANLERGLGTWWLQCVSVLAIFRIVGVHTGGYCWLC